MSLKYEELLNRIKHPEDRLTERKPQSLNDRELAKTIVAFANSMFVGETGVLFIGIADDGRVIGVDDTDALQKRVREVAENKCYPSIKYVPEVISVEGKLVLAVQVGASEKKPHSTGTVYVRKGSQTEKASPENYEKLIAGRLNYLDFGFIRGMFGVYQPHSGGGTEMVQNWQLNLLLSVVPRSPSPLRLSEDMLRVRFQVPGSMPVTDFDDVKMYKHDGWGLSRNAYGLWIEQPGYLHLKARATKPVAAPSNQDASIILEIEMDESEFTAKMNTSLRAVTPDGGVGKWVLNERSVNYEPI